jgi:hypothetical protein
MGIIQVIDGFTAPHSSNSFDRIGSTMLIRFAHAETDPLIDVIELPRLARAFTWMRSGAWIDMERIAFSLHDMLTLSFDLNCPTTSEELTRRRRWRQAVECAFGADHIDAFAQLLSLTGALGAAQALKAPFEDIERAHLSLTVQAAIETEPKRL